MKGSAAAPENRSLRSVPAFSPSCLYKHRSDRYNYEINDDLLVNSSRELFTEAPLTQGDGSDAASENRARGAVLFAADIPPRTVKHSIMIIKNRDIISLI